MAGDMVQHISHEFDVELHTLSDLIERMGALVDQQLTAATHALLEHDRALADHTVAADGEVDRLQRSIEERAILTIARRQPMALDLRAIIGAMRIANDLERVGDLAENIAKRASALAETIPHSNALETFKSMVELASSRLRRVVKAYVAGDTAEALEVWRGDAEIDAMNKAIFQQLLLQMENPRNIPHATHLLFCSKNVERIGDHATNIAETIYYIAKGEPIMEERPKG
jgi:phosphate transport system protein